jgi:alpha-N-arabinofuranosidase
MRLGANTLLLGLLCGTCCGQATAESASATVTLRAGDPGRAISPELFGVFFEDLNYAADGGLYAELIQNRSFEYAPAIRHEWHALTAWSVVPADAATGAVSIAEAAPLHPHNPHYAVLAAPATGGVVGLRNDGFDGIPVQVGSSYVFSVFARQLTGQAAPLQVRLESKDGAVLGEAVLPAPGAQWARSEATLHAVDTDPAARLVLLAAGAGQVAVDMVSLFPRATFRGRANGLRADLAQAIADLQPKFMRFPGGCLVHGDGLANMYRWKDTVGPVEQRRGQRNIWRYHQSVGLGYFEYFQFCADIGAQPLPVVAAGVCCQNSHTGGKGQRGLPLDEMPAYTQEVLDLVEWANGPATSRWGAVRAAAGHPAPFGLKYLGVGNEDEITPVFRERYALIEAAVRARHPELTVIGTVGPFPDGRDFEAGWQIARELKVAMVDEHYYRAPDWFWKNLGRYDRYDRASSAVYVGEYAAHDQGRRSTLRSALAEAAWLTELERNGDIVRLSSYAPLLARQDHTQWRPDLIYFDGVTVSPTINYEVQRLFSCNAGDRCRPLEVGLTGSASTETLLTASCVTDSRTGALILKLVSRAPAPLRVAIDLSAAGAKLGSAAATVLAGDPEAENVFGRPPAVVPQTAPVAGGPRFEHTLPAHSLTVLRFEARR